MVIFFHLSCCLVKETIRSNFFFLDFFLHSHIHELIDEYVHLEIY